MARTLEYAPANLDQPRPPRLLVWNTLLLLALVVAWLPTAALAALDSFNTVPQLVGILFTVWIPALIVGFAAWHSVFRSSRASTGFMAGAYAVALAFFSFAAIASILEAVYYGEPIAGLVIFVAAGGAAAYFGINAWLSWRWFRALPPS